MDNSERQTSLERLYKKSSRKGRNAAAYYIDKAFITLSAAVLLYLTACARLKNSSVSMALTAVCVLLYMAISHIIERLLFDRHVKKLRSDTKREIAKLRLALEPEAFYNAIKLPAEAYAVRSAQWITADDVKEAYRKGKKVIVGAAEPTEQAAKLMGGLGIELRSPLEDLELNALELMHITEEDIDDWLIARSKQKKKLGRKAALGALFRLTRERGARYFCTGALLFALSFVTRYALYYRLAAWLCLTIGAAVFGIEKLRRYSSNKNRSPER